MALAAAADQRINVGGGAAREIGMAKTAK